MDMTKSAIIEVEITLFYDVTFVRQRGPSMARVLFLFIFRYVNITLFFFFWSKRVA